MLWRRVQVERPRASTSGGQSGWDVESGTEEEEGEEAVVALLVEVWDLVTAAQEAKEVQLRHL